MLLWFSVVKCFESVDDSSTNFKEPTEEERIIVRT